ncbi:MAG: putative toxin-antitoxin system toxin component, PIN family [bacterium]
MNQHTVIVIDSNVWISALIFGGNPEKILKLFIDNKVEVVMSEEIITELRRIIINKFPLFVNSLNLLEASLRKDTVFVQLGSITIDASRDVDDNRIIETAYIGKAQYIISGDKDLLVLKKYEDIKILNPSEFLKIF